MPFGPSRCSITAEAARRFDRQKLREIEFDNRPQGIGERTVLLIVRQRVQPCGIFALQFHGRGDGIVPALDPAATVDWTADANDGRTVRVRGAVARLPSMGPGHRCFTDWLRRHWSTPWHCVIVRPLPRPALIRYVTDATTAPVAAAG